MRKLLILSCLAALVAGPAAGGEPPPGGSVVVRIDEDGAMSIAHPPTGEGLDEGVTREELRAYLEDGRCFAARRGRAADDAGGDRRASRK